MALAFYASSARDFATGLVSWVAATYNLVVMTSTYTFSAAHDFRNDLTNEVTGTGYTAGGLLLANRTASAANPCVMTADDIIVTQNAGGFTTGRKYSIAKILGGASSADPLLANGTAGADFGNVSGALTLDVPASWITLTV